jgi:hypothetical protein
MSSHPVPPPRSGHERTHPCCPRGGECTDVRKPVMSAHTLCESRGCVRWCPPSHARSASAPPQTRSPRPWASPRHPRRGGGGARLAARSQGDFPCTHMTPHPDRSPCDGARETTTRDGALQAALQEPINLAFRPRRDLGYRTHVPFHAHTTARRARARRRPARRPVRRAAAASTTSYRGASPPPAPALGTLPSSRERARHARALRIPCPPWAAVERRARTGSLNRNPPSRAQPHRVFAVRHGQP